jgi:acyl CoA:acetate/3-ketoacid CoA transferase alpha subunit
MDQAYQDIIRRRLELPLHEGPDKTATLDEAVRRRVEPGDTLYVGAARGRANAAVREIARQWWGKTPGFTLAAVGIGSPWTALIHGTLVRRAITTFMGEGYPFPTPQALISRAVLEGRLEVQNWSMLTFPLRLLAGADAPGESARARLQELPRRRRQLEPRRLARRLRAQAGGRGR